MAISVTCLKFQFNLSNKIPLKTVEEMVWQDGGKQTWSYQLTLLSLLYRET